MTKPLSLVWMVAVLVGCSPITARSQASAGALEPVGPAKSIVATVFEANPVCGERGFHGGCGPLLADLTSFRDALAVLDSTPVETWFPAPVADLPAASAYRCRSVGGGVMTTCMMLHSGIHTDVVASSLVGEVLTLDIRLSWFGPSVAAGKSSGIVTDRYVFARAGAEWRLRQLILIQAT